jgi:antitoxin component YwqK of YwqJK toxin-antitoxin module
MMRNLTVPILLLTLLFPSLAFGETIKTIKDLVKTNGLYYKKFTDVPFTGKVRINTTGETKSQIHATFKDGKFDGPYITYFSSGRLRSKGTYRDGKRDGPWVGYNKDGTVMEKYTGTYKNGVKAK